MKVGILTFQQAINYGAILQLYALQYVLQKLQIDANVINYISPKLKQDYKVIKFDTLKDFLAKIFVVKAFCERKRRFENFEKFYLNLTKEFYTKNELKFSSKKYDYIITGSDQVWNYLITNTDTTYLLDFVEDRNKKLSYAASFGVENIPDNLKEKYKNLLKDFKAISVREKQGQNIIKELCNLDVPVVLDPTLLLDKNEWSKLNFTKEKRKKYILVYCLRKSDLLNGMAKTLQRETGFKLVILNPRARFMYSKFSAATAGPEEFVELFMNAEFILTNSFHGTAFSINFNKRFLVDLDTKSVQNTNSRLLNILELVNLTDRIVVEPQDIRKMYEDIDYRKVNEILDIERKTSLDYLKISLGINE